MHALFLSGCIVAMTTTQPDATTTQLVERLGWYTAPKTAITQSSAAKTCRQTQQQCPSAEHVLGPQPYSPQLSSNKRGEIDQLPTYAIAALRTPTEPSQRSIARAEKRAAQGERTQTPKWLREAQRAKGRKAKFALRQAWQDNE